MKRIIKITGLTILVVLITGFIVYNFFPGFVLSTMQKMAVNNAGLEHRQVTIDEYVVNYYEGGFQNKETLVLLHGLADDKNSFVTTVTDLTKKYRIILPDLGGHGENLPDKARNYSIKDQVDLLDSFLSSLALNSFYLGGNSMGGHTAASYTYHHQEKVKALILLNATGILLNDTSVFHYFPEKVDRAFMDEMMTRVFAGKPSLPNAFIDNMIAELNPKIPFLNDLIRQVEQGEDFALNEKMHKVYVPTYVLWGKEDPVVPIEYAETYHKKLPNSKLKYLENASHSPQFEIPAIIATEIKNFITNSKDMKIQLATTKEGHLAKTQFYRWYQLYERDMNEQRINNQMDILADDIYLQSAAGEMKGKANYPGRLKAYEGWQNAHHVQNIEVIKKDEGQFTLEADIRYQNIRPDGERKSYSIQYVTELTQGDEFLPKFSKIVIQPTGENKDSFSDAYPTNRVKSLMHYWLALVENLNGDVEPFKEILANGFELNFSTSSQINSIEELEAWLNGVPKQLKQSMHYPEKFSVKPILKNEYEMTVEFDWKGVAKDDKNMKARTKHTWYVVDNPNDRFAKVLKVDVSQIEPFQIVE